ncbi:MAG: nucleoside hydrolase [Anaerolineae bacterium]|nr:nucleoside hydrolase [Anaerolineae bacterium]
MPIVIDTDTGTDVDDVLALTFALASPEVDLIGVTVVDADVDTRARIVARLLGMAGRPDIPVFKGLGRPLGEGRMPTWFGHEGKGILDVEWSGEEATIHDQPAPDWLIEQSHTQPYHLVMIGAFTNFAAALRQDPGLAQHLPHCTVMGGMVHAESFGPQWKAFLDAAGFTPAFLDHNTASDVEAALMAARSGIPMTWVTAELTFNTPLHRHAIQEFRDTATPLGEALAAMIAVWNELPLWRDMRSAVFPPDVVALLHDPLALSSIFNGNWLEFSAHKLRFASENQLFRIMETDENAEATHQVSTSVDQQAFEELFVTRVTQFLDTLSKNRE